jgi:hypothetical protein
MITGREEYLFKKAKQTRANYCKFDNFDKVYLKKKYNITPSVLDKLLFYYDEGFFHLQDIFASYIVREEYTYQCKKMFDDKLIIAYRELYKDRRYNCSETKPYYTLTNKGRRIVEEYYALKENAQYDLDNLKMNTRLKYLLKKINAYRQGLSQQ